MAETVLRRTVFDGLSLASPTPRVAFAAPAPCGRFLFWGDRAAADAAGRGFGVALPLQAGRTVRDGRRAALWLGPDEWLLLLPEDDVTAVTQRMAETLAGVAHALVDVGHRQAAIGVRGALAAVVLNAGCPLDLDILAFPPGACTRTLFGKAEIVLWRREEGSFHVEVARSFVPYVAGLLVAAARGIG
jgi:sarcosine oxidase, subunit gamma